MNQNEIYDEPPCSERPRDQPRDRDEDCSAPIIRD